MDACCSLLWTSFLSLPLSLKPIFMVDEREREYTKSINQMLRNFWKRLQFILVYLSAINTAMVLKFGQEKYRIEKELFKFIWLREIHIFK